MNRILIPEDKLGSETLIIDAVAGKSIYGAYECQATNELGQANKTFILQEGHPPGTITDVSLYIPPTL